MEFEIKKLTAQEASQILEGIRQLPMVIAEPLFNKIKEQLLVQDAKQKPAPAPHPEAPAPAQ